jgi:hypothetical protein
MSFNPEEATAEQRIAMQWAFLEAAERARATGAVEASCREVGVELGTPEDVATRLVSLYKQWAVRYGPVKEEEGKDAAINT